jgi:predicted nucleotidyltransferase component of viral defense system
MSTVTPVQLVRNEFELRDLVERLGRAASLVEQDFALMTIAAGLVAEYGDALCFKGGFVLRHVHGHERFSKDIDLTRINPPKSKLDAVRVADTIRHASVRNLMRLTPSTPATDSGRSLDFDEVAYAGPLGRGSVAVEVSYREDVVERPRPSAVGPPYYEPFLIPTMTLPEIVAEKLRALAQRDRPTDLADLAMVLDGAALDAASVRAIAARKFELVKAGDRRARIEATIERMRPQYDAAIAAVAPDAPDYAVAAKLVSARLGELLP